MAKKEDTGKRPNEPSAVVTYWLNEIRSSKKRENDFRKDGQRVLEIYSAEKAEDTPFNILFSNTETIFPAIYSQVPRPVVQRRFKSEDPMGKQAALAGQRVLEFLLDTNVEGYETFDDGVKCAVLDALLPGRGVACVKYDADIQNIKQDDGTETPYKASELVCLDTRSWDRVHFGYARKWSKVPWIAYEEYIDKDEATRLFGAEVANKINYSEGEEDDEEENSPKSEEDRETGSRKTALVYQIWVKEDKKIKYISPQYKEGYLKELDDPLGLTGFYNTPKPIQFLSKKNQTPVSLYKLYENQAKELNRLTVRINRIVDAIKARGVYDTELGDDIGNIMKEDDNALVPAEKSSSLAAEKGLDNAIWFMPVEQLVKVLRELYVAREQCKQVIYEIIGIADILRGSSKASETLGAQEIKERWGGLRIKNFQKEVQRYARDLLRMMLEISATKFSEETFAKMTGLPFVSTDQRMQLEQIAAAAQMAGQSLDPQTQQALSAPVWGKVIELLKDDTQRSFRIDIETNSTVTPEAAEDQKQISELMNALSQYMNGIGPLVLQGVMPFEAAQAMLLAITRRFQFGSEIEDYIKQMKPPQPDQSKQQEMQAKLKMEQEKHQSDLQSKQMDMKAKEQDNNIKVQLELLKVETEKAKAELERQSIMLEMTLKREEHLMKMAEMKSKHEVNMANGRMKMEQMKKKSESPRAGV